MFRAPTSIEEALWAATRDALPDAAVKGRALHRAIANRSRLYTTDRANLADGPDHPDADLAARALFFSIADAAKVMTPLAELVAAGCLPERAPLRVLDLGAGAGAMSLGTWAWLRGRGDDRPIEVRAVDQDGPALAIFADAARRLDDALSVERVCRSLAEPGWGEGFDLILAGTVINELPEGVRRNLVRRALGVVADDGAVVLIEPALRETSRGLHELRDWVLGDELARVFAPCTRRAASCPALADERDWCHEDRRTQLPPRAAELARVTGLRTSGMKWSYLTLRVGDGTLCPEGAVRVVSQPRKLKGRRELTGCSDRGWEKVRLLKRNRSSSNDSVEDARRGDILVTTGGADIARDDQVELRSYRD